MREPSLSCRDSIESAIVQHSLTGRPLAADFLIIITSRAASCRLLSHSIYQATDFRLLPLSPVSTTNAILDHPVEKELVSLVENGLRNGRLWFSYGWDLTNSLQRQYERAQESEAGQDGLSKEAIWRRADDRFFWNKFLMTKLIQQTERGGQGNDLSRFILPLLFGCKFRTPVKYRIPDSAL